MAQYTLLDYIQSISSSLNSDEVNSFDDSVESLQIANIVKQVFYDLQSRAELPEDYVLCELTASTDPLKPVVMYKPTSVASIEWIEYDKRLTVTDNPLYQPVTFLPLDEFLKMQDMLALSEDEVDSLTINIGDDVDSITFLYRNNKAPTYWTTYNDFTVIFDSFNVEVDDTLQKDKTRCYGRRDYTFELDNNYVPFVDMGMATLLLNEAKVLAFAELKQMPHEVAQVWAKRGWSNLNKHKRSLDQNRSELDRLPSYSRKK